MSELATVARPYAKAAFELAKEAGSIEQWQNGLEFVSAVVTHELFVTRLNSGLTQHELAANLVAIGEDKLSKELSNFVRVVGENNRLQALPAVLELFNHYKSESEQHTDVEVTSAVELTGEQLDSLKTALEKQLSLQVTLNCKQDSTLIAGLIIKAGDIVIDGSVRSKLSRLSNALQA